MPSMNSSSMESLGSKMKKSLPRWWKKRFSASITESDPSCKVVYLGNVLTGWAKGDGCLDKPLATLWKNYCQSSRPDVSMRLSVCSSGLQATTAEHGLTEYWAHRVTWCAALPSYPRIFAWVYRHEGRRLKQELRCHAVLCTTSRQARQLTVRLEQRLREALHDFRREKLCRQSARLSVASCLYDDYSNAIPKRKLLLAPGINNYKPPVERCKSAPKLFSIEESPEQEEVEEKDWLRVLAQRSASGQQLRPKCAAQNGSLPLLRTLETVCEEERCHSPPPPAQLSSRSHSLTSIPDNPAEAGSNGPDDVSPNGLQDLAEVKVTLIPDGGVSCVDGPPPSREATPAAVTGGATAGASGTPSEAAAKSRLPLPSILCRRIGFEAHKMFGSADCVTTTHFKASASPPTPPPLPRRSRRSLPCRAANINEYTAELQHNRVLTRRQSQPEYVGVARRPTSEYFESRDEYLFNEMDFRLRLDSAVESDSFSESPCSSAEHSPNLAEKGRLNLGGSDPPDNDNDNVSDESGYSDDKDVISSSSSASDVPVPSTASKLVVLSSSSLPSSAPKVPFLMAEEFTLNL